MVVSQTCDLHERINHGRPNASEASLHQILAYEFCFWCLDWDLACVTESVSYWLVVYKPPAVVAEGSKLMLNLQKEEPIKNNIRQSDRTTKYTTTSKLKMTKKSNFGLSIDLN